MTQANAIEALLDDASYAFPSSYAQHRLWILDQLEQGRSAYNVPMQFTITGPLNADALTASISALVERHETLRTVFEETDSGGLLQVVLPHKPVLLDVLESFDWSASDVDSWCTHEANASFDLRTGPVIRAALLKTAADSHILSITVHHIAFDGWSMSILTRELHAFYAAFVAGSKPRLPDLPIQYADFTIWQRAQSDTPEFEASLSYWCDQLTAPLPTLDVATGRARHDAREHALDHVAIQLDVATTHAVQRLAAQSGTTPFMVLLTVFEVLLHRHSGQSDIVVGTPVSGRAATDTGGLIGCFVNTLAIRSECAGAPNFRTMLTRTRTTMLAALTHDCVPFERVVAAVRAERLAGRNPLFQALFSLYDSGDPLALDGLGVVARSVSLVAAKVDLQLLLQSTPAGICGALEFDSDLFDVETASRLAQHFVTLVTSAVADPALPVAELAMVSSVERFTLLHEWNRTTLPYRDNVTVPMLFEERVALMPDSIAVVDECEELTYRALDERANAIASQLLALGVGADMVVALCADRSAAMLIGALGIMKAGGAYLALDPTYPQARLTHMLRDSVPRVLVAETRQLDKLPEHGLPVILLDKAPSEYHASTPPIIRCGARSSNLAYVVYTSGSTGTPKGVGVEHRALVNLLTSMAREPGFTVSDTLLAVTSLSFDIAALELWLPLVTGGRVVIAPRSATVDGEQLAALLDASHATVLQATPATWGLLLAAGWTGNAELVMMCGGEVLTPTLAAKLLPRGRALWNMYGPAETTIWSTAMRVTDSATITLGRPIANTIVRVLDEQRALVPLGVAGELYIGGHGLARGYTNDPIRTASRFVADPFIEDQRLYRTGDRVRWCADGMLEFLGRFDDQVKIRGHRVELAEVEHAVASHADVESCAAIVRSQGGEQDEYSESKQLIAFYVSVQNAAPSLHTLRSHVKRILAPAMMPDAFVSIDALPLGPTGKVDRRALAKFDAPVQRKTNDKSESHSTIEFDLVRIWERLLGVHPIGIHEDFFELGGHSLLAVQMLAAIESVRGRRLPLATLFEDATIKALAGKIESEVYADNEPLLTVLQGDAVGKPFVFVHGDTNGGGWYCRRLAPLLGAHVPLIVLGTIDCTSPGSPQTVEDVAAVHVKALRQQQQHGPYRIGGFCIGGSFAFEIARQLRAAGEIVERVILVDPNARPEAFPRVGAVARDIVRTIFRREDQRNRRLALFDRVRYYASRADEVRALRRREQIDWMGRMVRRLWRRTRNTADAQSPADGRIEASVPNEPLDASARELSARPAVRIFDALREMAATYMPRAYDGSIDVFVSDGMREMASAEMEYGWTRVGNARVHDVPGSHFGLVTTELPALAAAIRSCLNERATSEGP